MLLVQQVLQVAKARKVIQVKSHLKDPNLVNLENRGVVEYRDLKENLELQVISAFLAFQESLGDQGTRDPLEVEALQGLKGVLEIVLVGLLSY